MVKVIESVKRTIMWVSSLGFQGIPIASSIIEFMQFYFYYCWILANTFNNAKWKSNTPNQLTHLDVMHAKHISLQHYVLGIKPRWMTSR